jgi:hypothetical protein
MYCDLFVDNQILEKRAKNEEGCKKLRRELAFYKVVKDSALDFPVPLLIDQSEYSYTMQYYDDYVPLYTLYWSTTSEHQQTILSELNTYLHRLHIVKCQSISKNIYLDSFLLEIYTKPLARYAIIEPILNQYSFTHVNGEELDTFHDILAWIKKEVSEIIDTKDSYEFCLIHGDCQFNNILYKKETNEFVFLDPRGYFGLSEIWGPVEYDSAKLLFARSGYDLFDTMEVTSLDYDKENLILPILWKDEILFQRRGLDLFLFLSIWLSNAHSFLASPKKAVFSYYYAVYLSTLVKRSFRDETK